MKKLAVALLVFPLFAFAGSETVKPKGKPGTHYPVLPVQELTCAEAKAYIQEYGFYWSGTVDIQNPVPIWGFIGWWDSSPVCYGRKRLQAHFRRDVTDAASQPYGGCILGYDCLPM